MNLAVSQALDPGQLEELLQAYSIGSEFIDFGGNVVRTPLENRLHILSCMGVTVHSPDELQQALKHVQQQRLGSLLPSYTLGMEQQAVQVSLQVSEARINDSYSWQLLMEDGGLRSGSFTAADLPVGGQQMLHEQLVMTLQLTLDVLPVGYHRLQLESAAQQKSESLLIIAPRAAWQTPQLNEGQRMWGISVQLYTLRSDSNWGMGDFQDLLQVCTEAAGRGADFILLNPLHSPDLLYPDNPSPYSPDDRRFLNPLYIHLPWCDEFHTPEISEYVFDAGFQQKLAQAQDSDNICYAQVADMKLSVLELMYSKFQEREITDLQYLQFQHFARAGGRQLADFACFQAERLGNKGGALEEPAFHIFLQWLAQRQLQECHEQAINKGMRIGLVRDLAVGSKADGCEVLSNEQAFCLSARIGAPPDNFNPDGQNWGLPPLRPDMLQHSACSHIRYLLRANMRSCGALRIDHVMSLMRLWWCPDDGSNATGAYVYYPVDALFAILKLESVRQQCLVIGEDLGVVPPEIRGYLDDGQIYSNCVLYFEKYDGWHFRKPEHYKPRALAMVANHDVPPLASWWSEGDLALRYEIGLIPDAEKYHAEQEWRRGEKGQLLVWLRDQGLLPQGWNAEDSGRVLDEALKVALMRACGRLASALVSVQLDDLAGSTRPVNIPGTNTEYDNWRHKLPVETDAIFSSTLAEQMMQAMQEGRRA